MSFVAAAARSRQPVADECEPVGSGDPLNALHGNRFESRRRQCRRSCGLAYRSKVIHPRPPGRGHDEYPGWDRPIDPVGVTDSTRYKQGPSGVELDDLVFNAECHVSLHQDVEKAELMVPEFLRSLPDIEPRFSD